MDDPLTPQEPSGSPRGLGSPVELSAPLRQRSLRESRSRPARRGSPRRSTSIWRAAAVLGVLCAGVLTGASADARTGPSGEEQIGPSWDPEGGVWADSRARMRVRGDRPEGASIHTAYAGPVDRWDDELRRDLSEFETDAFPEAAAPRKTIVDEPPEAWMRQLELPDIPVRWNAKTIEYLRYFKDDPKGQRMISAWLQRMGRYEPRLRTIMAEAGVPEDLMYVAMIESGFNPSAHSGVGAAGMWQFMEPTGRVYGLEADYWTDDRLDFERSSYAAAAYLADLKARFGTWELALAAYNAGYGLVVQSIRRNNTNNFWALSEIENGLPRQTSNYVPKMLAAAIVGHNRAVFGVSSTPRPALELIDVQIEPGTRIEDLAKALGYDEDILAEINATYLRGRVSPEGGPSTVRIPRSKHAAFEALSGEIASTEQRWSSYAAKLGDDLESIAAAHGITQKQLRRINAIHDSGEVKAGVVLVVPASPAEGSPDSADTPSLPPLVAVPPLRVPPGTKLVFFRVTRATASSAIASRFDVAWQEIVAWNDLDPNARLVDGQMLQILVKPDFDPDAAGVTICDPGSARHVIRGSAAHLVAVLADRDLRRRGYKIGKGDSFERVAKKFGLSTGSLGRINGVARNHRVAIGDVLIVYVAKGKSKGTVKAPEPTPTSLTAELEVATSLAGAQAGAATDGRAGARKASTPATSRIPGRKYKGK